MLMANGGHILASGGHDGGGIFMIVLAILVIGLAIFAFRRWRGGGSDDTSVHPNEKCARQFASRVMIAAAAALRQVARS